MPIVEATIESPKGTPKATPKKVAKDSPSEGTKSSPKTKIDHHALAMEVALAHELGKQPDWNEIAVTLGSATGNAIRVAWNSTRKNYLKSKGFDPDMISATIAAITGRKGVGKEPSSKKRAGDALEKDAGEHSKKIKANTQKRMEDDSDGDGSVADDAGDPQGRIKTESEVDDLQDF